MNELYKYFDLLKSPVSPISYSILLTAIVLFVIYFTNKKIYLPLLKKHAKEKENLLAEYQEKMALLSIHDPDPIIRIDSEGIVQFANVPAKMLLGIDKIEDERINSIIPGINISPIELVEKNATQVFHLFFNNKSFSVFVTGISAINSAQIYMHDISELKEKEVNLEESQNKLSELSNRLQDLIEEQKQSFAGELHDNIGQTLLMLKMKLNKLTQRYQLLHKDKDYIEAIELIDQSVKEMKEIVLKLKPKLLKEMGLIAALRDLCWTIASECNLKVSFNVSPETFRLNEDLELMLYRLAQEALNNIVKHSNAKEFGIHLIKEEQNINLMIYDDGKGFDYDKVKNSGWGLYGMNERVKRNGGIFKVDSTPGTGTNIIIEIRI